MKTIFTQIGITPLQRGNSFHLSNYLLIVLINLFLLIISACSSLPINQKQNSDTTICDSYSRNVTFKNNPQRIISAAPGITEIIFALGEKHRLIGRTDYCDFPREVKHIQLIGGLEDPNIETIASLDPDLVIASTHFKKEMVDKLKQVQIPIIVLTSLASFEGAYDLIANVGDILNVKQKADSTIQKMKTEVEMVIENLKHIHHRPKVYYVIGFGKTGDFTAGGSTFINQLIEMAGGNNIAKDIDGWSYSLEKLIEHDPDIIIIRKGDKAGFLKSPGYKTLKALKAGNVYEIDNNLIERTGPRLSEGLLALYQIIHSKK